MNSARRERESQLERSVEVRQLEPEAVRGPKLGHAPGTTCARTWALVRPSTDLDKVDAAVLGDPLDVVERVLLLLERGLERQRSGRNEGTRGGEDALSSLLSACIERATARKVSDVPQGESTSQSEDDDDAPQSLSS